MTQTHEDLVTAAADRLTATFRTAYVRRNATKIAAIVLRHGTESAAAVALRSELLGTDRNRDGVLLPVVYVDRNAEKLARIAMGGVA